MTTTDTTRIVITDQYAQDIVELLEICGDFNRTASAPTRTELAAHLDQRPGAPHYELLIDQLGFTALSLQAKLAHAGHRAGTR